MQPHLFSQWLEDQGIAESRCEDLQTAFFELLKALSALDSRNLIKVIQLGGIQGLLEKFEELEKFNKVGLVLRELTTVETTPSENLPLLIGLLETKVAQALLEKRLRGIT